MRTLHLPGVHGAKIPYAGKEKGRAEWGASPLNRVRDAADAAARDEVRNMRIMSLWRAGFNTIEIAEKVSFPESDVANRMALLRDRGAR